jgi:IS605 OrfB family transposase
VEVGGLDCNTDRLAVAVASPQGNLLSRHTVWMHDLEDARGETAIHIISKALDEALDFLQEQRAECLVVERLKFAQDHNTQRRYNRRTTRFRSTMVEMAVRKALRRGFTVVQVNPAYSSIIGKHKYADAYGMSVHEAAAFVLARRGQGRDERLPKCIVAQLPRLRECLIVAAEGRPAGDRMRHLYLKWADRVSAWKKQHHWSLWSIWDKASSLVNA